MTKANILKIDRLQIGTRITFSDGFYTKLSIERNANGSVTASGRTYNVGDEVEIINCNGKSVYNFE